MAKYKNNHQSSIVNRQSSGFTIVELLVAMSLLVILLGLSGMVFTTTVKAHRVAGATIEITRNLRAVTDQLNADFRGLRKDGEILLVWVARPAIDENGDVIDEDGNNIPDHYQKFDRIIFFADGDFQTVKTQALTAAAGGGSKIVHGNLARISYIMAKDNSGTPASIQPDRAGRILARTEHIVTADADLDTFPNPADLLPAAWNTAGFYNNNFYNYEYQTMTMADWTNMSDPTSPYIASKIDILTILSDVTVGGSTVADSDRGPIVEIGQTNSYPNLFCSGVGEFGIQIWLENQQRWYPEIDPNGDGIYTDTDYEPNGAGGIHDTEVNGVLYFGNGESNLHTAGTTNRPSIPLKFTALKFTFTLYDSKGIIPGGKTFTHIVYIGD